ncbi:MAG: DUF3472 domain-containing protein [Dysgonamonadaceae bacterium]|jgi:hypothetical protein|nr:DUF3472 domain-containing protein [Dysgonamonadaceae bacterium]
MRLKAILIFIVFLTTFTNLPAQMREINIRSGDSLILNMGGYTEGAIQWQRYSNDSKSWVNIPNASAKTGVLRYRPTQPLLVRAQVTELDCPPYYTDTLQVNRTKFWTRADTCLEGGHGYIWPFVSNNSGLSMQEKGTLTDWINKDRKARWYLYQETGRYDFSFIMTLTNGSTRDFKITCTPAYEGLGLEPVEREFSYTGRGPSNPDTVFALAVDIPKTGYFLYELESKNTAGSIAITSLALTGYQTPTSTTLGTPHLTNYLSSPSVHLHYKSSDAPNTTIYDWIYQEVLVPPLEEGFSHTATYWESIGFNGGYLGLQNNTNEWRRILFSVWDQIDTDAYKKAGRPLPSDSLVTLVDKGDNINANGFGGEGTGGQSYRQHAQTWKEGIPVKFLFNVRKDQADCASCPSGKKPTVILSAWYCAYEPDAPGLEDIPDSIKGWHYIASWRRPFVDSYQSGTGSFIENFGWNNGHLPRKGYYYNTYNRNQQTGQWYHFNESSGTHTDGKPGQRTDIEFGVSTDPGHTNQFYMLSGGYGSTKKTSGTFKVPYIPIENFPYLNNLDLQPYIDRVDQALVKEKAEQDFLKSKKDKTGWTIAYYSSQELNDNPDNTPRPASMIIDNDANTFWHSKWTSGGSSLPHILIIDMQSVQNISALYITQNGGSNYHIKGLQIGVRDEFSGNETGTNALATTDSNWTPVWSGDLPDASANTIHLENVQTGRYIRLKITTDWAYPPHVRVNEVDVFGGE